MVSFTISGARDIFSFHRGALQKVIEKHWNVVNSVHEASNQAGLYLNTSKTKVMKIIRVPVWNEQEYILANGQDIENVKNFVYLGAMSTEHYDDSKEIKRRIAIAKKCNDFTSQNVERQGNFNHYEKNAFKVLGL